MISSLPTVKPDEFEHVVTLPRRENAMVSSSCKPFRRDGHKGTSRVRLQLRYGSRWGEGKSLGFQNNTSRSSFPSSSLSWHYAARIQEMVDKRGLVPHVRDCR